jgi:ATP-dependent Clp protease ATP-binding subunit ClpC
VPVLNAGIPAGEPREDGMLLPFTPRTQKVLEMALREALSLGHNYIGTEHVLLGLLTRE